MVVAQANSLGDEGSIPSPVRGQPKKVVPVKK